MGFKILDLIKRFKVLIVSVLIGITLLLYHLFMSNDKARAKRDQQVVVDWYKNKQVEIISSQKELIERNVSNHDVALEENEVKIEKVNEVESKDLLDNINDLKRLGY